MRIVVPSCWAYRDCWIPFFRLLDHFWPNHPPVFLLTDYYYDNSIHPKVPATICVTPGDGPESWGPRLASFARTYGPDEILMLQEDFLLSAPVNQERIDHALEQFHSRSAGSVRLYPCPGSDEDYGDPFIGIVRRNARYRISCQATIFRPRFLEILARTFHTPRAFELQGTEYASLYLTDEVLATKRESRPWPLEYLCTAVIGSRWNPDAKRLCDSMGIENDWSLRAFA